MLSLEVNLVRGAMIALANAQTCVRAHWLRPHKLRLQFLQMSLPFA